MAQARTAQQQQQHALTPGLLAAQVAQEARARASVAAGAVTSGQQQLPQQGFTPATTSRPPVSLTPIRPTVAAAPAPSGRNQQNQQNQQGSVGQTTTGTVLAPGHVSFIDLDRRLRTRLHQAGSALLEVIYVSRLLRAQAEWEQNGYSDEWSYAADLGLAKSTWKTYSDIGDRLSHLSLEDLQGLKFSSATSLTKVPAALWPEYAWLEEARLLPSREFSMLVAQRTQERTQHKLPAPRVSLNLTVPADKHQIIERGLETLRRRAGLKTVGDTLAFALESADEAGLLRERLSQVSREVDELRRLWTVAQAGSGVQESAEEREVRYTAGPDSPSVSLTEAAIRTQQLLKSIEKTLALTGVVQVQTPVQVQSQSQTQPFSPTSPSTTTTAPAAEEA